MRTEAVVDPAERHGAWNAVKHGAAGGLAASPGFVVGAVLFAVLSGLPWHLPLRIIAAVALGPAALESTYPLLPALLCGAALHLGYTVTSGVLLGLLLYLIPALASSGRSVVLTVLMFAVAQWLGGFYLVAPLMGWWWFPQMTMPWQHFFIQVVFWGGLLALYFRWKRREFIPGPS